MSTQFFSDRLINTSISDIYERVTSPGINAMQITEDAKQPISNTMRKLSWARKYELRTGVRPSLNARVEHSCGSCKKPFYLPMGADVVDLFCGACHG